jgi:hypothetical protein
VVYWGRANKLTLTLFRKHIATGQENAETDSSAARQVRVRLLERRSAFFYNFARRLTVSGRPVTWEVLAFFRKWRTSQEALVHSRYTQESVLSTLSQLVKQGLLVLKGSPEAMQGSCLAGIDGIRDSVLYVAGVRLSYDFLSIASFTHGRRKRSFCRKCGNKFFKARIIPKWIKHRIEPEQRGGEWHTRS